MATTTELAQAQAAYHKLMTGTQAVEVRKSDGSSVKFTAANKTDLLAYINKLKYDLGLTTTPRRYAVKVAF